MENNAIHNLQKITVVIQGEADWLKFNFIPDELERLKKHTTNLALLGALMGEILDGSQVKVLSDEKKEKVERLLARYVANLQTYELMLVSDSRTMIITTFRIRDGKRTGYGTRVAGIMKESLDNIAIFIDGLPTPLEPHFMLLLDFISQSEPYAKESKSYDRKSIFHDLIRQAKLMEGKIEIRNQAPSSLQ
jgi:hypothetical protein